MNSIGFVSNEDEKFKNLLNQLISGSNRVTFAIAFGSLEGFLLVKSAFKKMVENNGSARFLFDVSQGMTSPELIEELSTFPGDVKVKICAPNSKIGFLHSKIYLFEGDQNSTIIGSNNFSIGGLLNNNEAALYSKNLDNNVFVDIKNFITNIWNSKFSIDPTAHPHIFDLYREIHASWKFDNFEKENHSKLAEITKEIEQLNTDESYQNNNLDIQYLLGALAANISYQEKDEYDKGRFIFKYRSQILNANNPKEKGFITNIVDGERLGNIRLPQIQTLKKYVEYIKDHISFFVKFHDPEANVELIDTTKTSFGMDLKVEFSNKNPIWTSLANYADNCKKRGAYLDKLVPFFPPRFFDDSSKVGLHFVQGYMDFRSRISQADRVGSILRIGVQIDKYATEFLYDLKDYLVEKQKHIVNVSDGSARGKDNMIRIRASEETRMLFNATWQKRMNIAFSDYNKAN